MTTLAVLDLAGTTVRDDGVVIAAFGAALGSVGTAAAGQRQLLIDTMGQSKISVFRQLLTDERRARMANEAFEVAYGEMIEDGKIEPMPGAVDTMRRLRDRGIRVCLVTGFSSEIRERLLTHPGWTDEVELALSPSQLIRGRPAPDLVLAAAYQLQVDDVRDIAVVGDTVNDLLSGYRAGAGVVAGVLTGAHDRDTLAKAPHTHLLPDITGLPGAVGLA